MPKIHPNRHVKSRFGLFSTKAKEVELENLFADKFQFKNSPLQIQPLTWSLRADYTISISKHQTAEQ